MSRKAIGPKTPRFIKLPEVKRLTSLSTSEIYRRIGAGAFPKQIRVGQKSVVWLEHEVHAWLLVMIDGRYDDEDGVPACA